MTLSELADVGELVGGVAVVASSVYLALQVRQNTRAVRVAYERATSTLLLFRIWWRQLRSTEPAA